MLNMTKVKIPIGPNYDPLIADLFLFYLLW